MVTLACSVNALLRKNSVVIIITAQTAICALWASHNSTRMQECAAHTGREPSFILAFKIFKGEVDLNPSEFFLRPPRAGLRGHTYRLLQGPSRLRQRSGAFSVRIVEYWNRLPVHLVLEPSVSIFKKQLDRHWFEIFPAAPV